MTYQKPEMKRRYDNYIGGKWVAPVGGEYFTNKSPIDGSVVAEFPRSKAADVELACQAAWAAAPAWGATAPAERSHILLRVADRLEANAQELARIECWGNGKPIRECVFVDVPGTIDQIRYFAAALRADSGESAAIDAQTLNLEVYEPYGVVACIIPWNAPLLMAAMKIAPALAAGNAVILKPAQNTPYSITRMMEMIGDLLPPGVLNIVQGSGAEAGQALVVNRGVKKIAFTGSAEIGKGIMRAAAENLTPVTLELGGKSPNIFLPSIMAADDELLDKAIEGFLIYLYDQGEVCASPTRALVADEIYEPFMARVQERLAKVGLGHPLEMSTGLGAITSKAQYDTVMGYLDIGREEGAKVLAGGGGYKVPGCEGGYYIAPTILEGTNDLRTSREEIFGPVTTAIRFKDEAEALRIANDSPYGLTAGVWTRDYHQMQRFARGLEVGKVWCNCYYLWPAHTSFGGYKESGFGREMHKVALNNYRHTKSIVHSYSTRPLGFF
ncbi:aldehyde dehydrogenase [Mesorhizobium soli]|uniref:aldehyde dehydrogenase family protein n=1 Tax=Pseudaminobacter soli (ex Li et al. 2025) TaxID=1295366 RepID=UPI0024766DC5|nr:aldehyde dehydrogenase family protein [Mesorhizobium soli]MDH6230771.1 aldehyde dehydrogenase [Mesorhizobium soli]